MRYNTSIKQIYSACICTDAGIKLYKNDLKQKSERAQKGNQEFTCQ